MIFLYKPCNLLGTGVGILRTFKLLFVVVTILIFELNGTLCDDASENSCRYPGTCGSSVSSSAATCHTCREGYVKDLVDDTRCQFASGNNASVILLAAEEEAIELISLDGLNITQQRLQTGGNIQSIDYISQTNTLFWFSGQDYKIYRAPLEAGGNKTAIIQNLESWIFGLAVDWVHGNIYWTDNSRKQISVSNLNGTTTKVLINNGLSFPTSIVVNPLNGWMHWTDFSESRIERAGMDGSRREVIISSNLIWPNGLTLDLVQNRLYWTESIHPRSISSSNFDGSDRKLVFSVNQQHSSSSLFPAMGTWQDSVYWTDGRTNTIHRVNKCTGQELTRVYQHARHLKGFKFFNTGVQPAGENLCSKNRNRQCSHLCFPVPVPENGNLAASVTTTCACPDGLRLSSDKRICH